MDPEETQRMEPLRIRRNERDLKVTLRVCAIVLLILGVIGIIMFLSTFGR
jgi:hypothetical protein